MMNDGDKDGKHRTDDHVDPLKANVGDLQSLVHDRGLLVELHPGRNGGADGRDHNRHKARVKAKAWRDESPSHGRPRRLGQDTRCHVCQIDGAGHQKDPFDHLVVGLEDQHPDQDRGDRHRDILADAQDLHAGRHAGELADGVAQVGQDHHADDDRRGPHAHGLADQIGQAFAGDHAQPGAHLLDNDQGQGDERHDPQQAIAIVGAGDGIGGDPTGVVIDVGGDDARPDNGQQGQQPDPQRSESPR